MVLVVGLLYVEVAKNGKFLHIPYRWKVEQPATWQHNGIKNSETKICMWKFFVKIIWKPVSMKMSTTLRVRSLGSAFC